MTEIRCVRSVYRLGDGRQRVYYFGGGTSNYARLIGAIKLGRPLSIAEVAHHRNGICNDDRLENIEVLSSSDHSRWHGLNPRARRIAPGARDVVFSLRLEDGFKTQLAAIARESNRSLNAEIIQRLQISLNSYRR